MKEQAGIIPTTEADKVVIVGENEQAFQEVKWRIKQQKGHRLYEINMQTGDVKEAEFESVDMELSKLSENVSSQAVRKKVITKHNCIYISALNIKNAAKKFAKKAKDGGLIK